MRDYPVHSIAMLILAVTMLAVLAKQAHRYGLRANCEVYLAAGCFLCVISMAATAVKHYVPEKEQPIPSVRLSDLTSAHHCETCKGGER